MAVVPEGLGARQTRSTSRGASVGPWVRALLALGAAVFGGPSAAQPAGPSPLMGAELRTLPNGLRLIVREQHQAPLVALDVWVRAGSAREGAGEVGAAHFIEHLIFKGTPTRKPGEIDEAIEGLGATLAAGTTRDAAHFYTTVSAEYWQTALDVVADALQNAALRPEDVERERAVILDELAWQSGDPRRTALDRLHAALFGAHGYGRPPAGEADPVRRLSHAAIVGFWRRLYAPNNATVVVVGDVSPSDVEASVARAFGGWPRREVPAPPPAPRLADGRRDEAPSGQPGLVAVGYGLGPAADASTMCVTDLAAALLGNPQAGRVSRALASQRLGTDPGGEHSALRDAGVLALYAAPTAGHAADACRVLADEAERLGREKVPPAELEWARARALGAWLYEAETDAGQARLLGLYDVAASYRAAVEYADALRRVTAADLLAFGSRYLVPAARAVVVAAQRGAP